MLSKAKHLVISCSYEILRLTAQDDSLGIGVKIKHGQLTSNLNAL
jgi:hypothetical protein